MLTLPLCIDHALWTITPRERPLHRIAITQIRLTGSPGQTYHRKQLANGKSTTESLRCLKRRLARTVFQRLKTDHHNRHLAKQATTT